MARYDVIKAAFNPRPGERIVVAVDLPHDDVSDTELWKDRREFAREWAETCKEFPDVYVDFYEFPATGLNNKTLPDDVQKHLSEYSLLFMMTQYSSTSTMKKLAKEFPLRAASMPGVKRSMEKSALAADYDKVKEYAEKLKDLLTLADHAKVFFDSGHELFIDLANQPGNADTGSCLTAGRTTNFPAGEAYIVPVEKNSRTAGDFPVKYGDDLVVYKVKNNAIIAVEGSSEKAKQMNAFFRENSSRANIAELGIGCNPSAVVSGTTLEDEKVGPHIAYGRSDHFIGGTVQSDVHQDIVYAKGCPIAATVTLVLPDSEITVAVQGEIQYSLLSTR